MLCYKAVTNYIKSILRPALDLTAHHTTKMSLNNIALIETPGKTYLTRRCLVLEKILK
jgi:hypothetical protein